MKEIRKPSRKTRKQNIKNKYDYMYLLNKKSENNIIYRAILTIVIAINLVIMCMALTAVIEFYYFSALWVFIGSAILEWLLLKAYKFTEKMEDVYTILLNRKGLDI